MRTEIRLENLPRLPLCHIMTYLPHSHLLNLSLTSKKLHELVKREWKYNPSLWHHITIPSNLTHSGLDSLKRALLDDQMKINLVQSIRISDRTENLSRFMCNVICSFHSVRVIVINSDINANQIVKILNSLIINEKKCKKCNLGKRLQYVEMTKINTRIQAIPKPLS